jgi:hypothetical protein
LLDTDSPDLRRLRRDLILAYKIFFGLVDVNAQDFSTIANSGHKNRGHDYRLLIQYDRVDTRKNLVWNSVTAAATDFRNLRSFRNLIMKADFIKFVTV